MSQQTAERRFQSRRYTCAGSSVDVVTSAFTPEAVERLDLGALQKLREDLAAVDRLASARIAGFPATGGRKFSRGKKKRNSRGSTSGIQCDKDDGACSRKRHSAKGRKKGIVPKETLAVSAAKEGNEELVRDLVWGWFTDERKSTVQEYLSSIGEKIFLSTVQGTISKAKLSLLRKERDNPDVRQLAAFKIEEAVLGREEDAKLKNQSGKAASKSQIKKKGRTQKPKSAKARQKGKSKGGTGSKTGGLLPMELSV